MYMTLAKTWTHLRDGLEVLVRYVDAQDGHARGFVPRGAELVEPVRRQSARRVRVRLAQSRSVAIGCRVQSFNDLRRRAFRVNTQKNLLELFLTRRHAMCSCV